MMINDAEIDPGSFRDPSGFVFKRNGILFRQINNFYKENYDFLIASNLYSSLVDKELLIPHEEVAAIAAIESLAYKIIKPKNIPFISYPYEWCFSQLKQAALLTLKIQEIALQHGMILKDSSAYNIQFYNGKPVFIDTLSFELYKKGEPWKGYKQFCQHFLSPLALMSFKDAQLNQLLKIFLDGIPLNLTSKLLPWRTYFRPSMFAHIHLHARSQKHFADNSMSYKHSKISKHSLLAINDSLRSSISKLNFNITKSTWSSYYVDNNYTSKAFADKKEIFSSFLEKINPKSLFDFGSNTGVFSKIASGKGINTVSFDYDQTCVEINYLETTSNHDTNNLPLTVDVSNPSPGIGWSNTERMSLLDRGPADVVAALALLHHLHISNNIPMEKMAQYFSKLCTYLIIEFIPLSDSQTKRLLCSKEVNFKNYSESAFETEFSAYFNIIKKQKIKDSERIMYLMQKNKKTK